MAITLYSEPFTISDLTGSSDGGSGKQYTIPLTSQAVADINSQDAFVIAMLDYTYEALNVNPGPVMEDLGTDPGTGLNGLSYRFHISTGNGGVYFNDNGFTPSLFYGSGLFDFVTASQSAHTTVSNNSTDGEPDFADLRRKTDTGAYNASGYIAGSHTSGGGFPRVEVHSSSVNEVLDMQFRVGGNKNELADKYFNSIGHVFFYFNTSNLTNVKVGNAELKINVKSQFSSSAAWNPTKAISNNISSTHSLILAKVDPSTVLTSTGGSGVFIGEGVSGSVMTSIHGSIEGTGSADASWIAVAAPSVGLVGDNYIINTYSSAILGAQYTTAGDQLPFSLGTPGARFLRGRPTAYAAEKGESVKDKDGSGKKGKKKKDE